VRAVEAQFAGGALSPQAAGQVEPGAGADGGGRLPGGRKAGQGEQTGRVVEAEARAELAGGERGGGALTSS